MTTLSGAELHFPMSMLGTGFVLTVRGTHRRSERRRHERGRASAERS